MKYLIPSYEKSKDDVRQGIRRINRRLRATKPDTAEWIQLKRDKSIMESMVRDLSDVILMLKNQRSTTNRSLRRTITMDPSSMSLLAHPANMDEEAETKLRSEIRENFQDVIKERLGSLTLKQGSTLERWIFQGRTMAEIGREDHVSRQAVWVRLFGDKTNRGALRILRTGR